MKKITFTGRCAMYKSELTKQELCQKWDEMTDPARFAGADDRTDLIYIGTRKDDRITLKRGTRSYQVLTGVFRGRIIDTGDGKSKIDGYFTKQIADYIIFGLLFAVIYVVAGAYLMRDPLQIYRYAPIFLSFIGTWLTLRTYKKTRIRYGEFIKSITGEEGKPPEGKSGGYKFRMRSVD